MASKHLKRTEGFTIIEVLIVLAIAGLIMLVVFLAVPALQRNSRNTQRKNDVSQLIGALQEYSNNNGGQLPADNTAFKTSVLPNAKLGFYDATADVSYTKNTTAFKTVPTLDNSKVVVETYAKCNGNALDANPSSRNVVALYQVEGSGGNVNQCLDM